MVKARGNKVSRELAQCHFLRKSFFLLSLSLSSQSLTRYGRGGGASESEGKRKRGEEATVASIQRETN